MRESLSFDESKQNIRHFYYRSLLANRLHFFFLFLIS